MKLLCAWTGAIYEDMGKFINVAITEGITGKVVL